MPYQGPIWFPYARVGQQPMPLDVQSASGSLLHLADGRSLIDATCSWWCMIHGYQHPEMVAALQQQAGQLCHLMLGGLSHAPARQLAARLVSIAPKGLTQVFFSDSGSVGVEVALKMAVQYQYLQGNRQKQRILALGRAYHGDTAGCMAVCDPDEGMHALFANYVQPQVFAPSPKSTWQDPRPLSADIAALEHCMASQHQQLAALIVEPLLQAAGGFVCYHPEYLRAAQRLCRRYGLLLIFDEVATGFGRTGKLFAANHLAMTPDIMVLSKGLTGGYLGHAATLARHEVYQAFVGSTAEHALMHGPTFMGNPLACTAALTSIELFIRDQYLRKIARIQACFTAWLLQDAALISHPWVRDVRVLGATAVIEVHQPEHLQGVAGFALEHSVWLRPIGRYLYCMPAYTIAEQQLAQVCQVMKDWFRRQS